MINKRKTKSNVSNNGSWLYFWYIIQYMWLAFTRSTIIDTKDDYDSCDGCCDGFCDSCCDSCDGWDSCNSSHDQ